MDAKNTIKILTGIIIIPFGIVVSVVWPWWEKQTMSIKVLSGILVLPITLLAAIVVSWWDNY